MKPLSFIQKHKRFLILVFMLIIGLALISASPQAPENSIVTPGWEIYNQIAGVRCAVGLKTGEGEFTFPNEIGGAQWKVDVDAPNYGEPTILIQSSDIRHVDFSGSPTANEQAAQTRIVERGEHTYYLDYHIYMFDVTIRTIADKVQVRNELVPFQTAAWEHETSWGKTSDSSSGDSGLWFNGHVGKPFEGGAYVKFVISPWRGQSSILAPNNYVIQDAWSGVMNSYVFNKQQGQVANQWGEQPNPSGDAPLKSVGALDNGAQINMYQDTGGFGMQAPKVNWDDEANPDSRIESAVVLYLPVQLEAGAYIARDILGTANGLTPCDVYVKYTVRIDVLTTHDFVLQSAYEPPELDIPTDFFSWVLGFWDGLFSSPNFYFFIILIALFVALWIVFRGKKGEDGKSKRFYGLTIMDWGVIAALLFLGVIPDPSDALDFGLPLLEGLGAAAYFFFRRRRGGEKT